MVVIGSHHIIVDVKLQKTTKNRCVESKICEKLCDKLLYVTRIPFIKHVCAKLCAKMCKNVKLAIPTSYS